MFIRAVEPTIGKKQISHMLVTPSGPKLTALFLDIANAHKYYTQVCFMPR